ncbi:acyl transferase/acyl hydrolase/lysophospholipase [Trichophaea hybrida]|nr:acyl transferase/acyl hydrolase/lysophospholipase [Trichophaea hybrida]
MACNHTTWLNLVTGSRDDRAVLIFDRLKAMIDAGVFQDPLTQTPSLITFVGGPSKNRILRGLVNKRSLQASKSSPSLCNLHVASSTSKIQSPVLVADCAPDPRIERHQQVNECCDRIRKSLSTSTQDATSFFSRVLGPFTDVLCLFSADFGGFEGCAKFIQSWMQQGFESSTFSRVLRPTLVLIMEGLGLHPQWDPTATQLFSDTLLSHNTSFSPFFPLVKVLRVPTGYRKVMRYLDPLIENRQAIRKTERCLFSLFHFNAFFGAACLHWAESPIHPFDFIQTTRLANPVPGGFSENFDRLIALLEPGIGLSLIASSLMLDCAPPGMHCFEPSIVFRRLYRETCAAAVCTRDFLPELKRIFVYLVSQMEKKGWTAAQQHKSVLEEYHRVFATTYSRLTCLCCLSRSPEFGLPCGHTLCEKCVETFGRKLNYHQHIFSMSTCPLCGKDIKTFRAHQKPPTAGIRLLSIDGGGVRGVLPLQALHSIELAFNELTGISGPVQAHFDLALGTRIGGLIVFGLFLNGWSVKECSSQFVQLAEKAFSNPRRVLMSVLTDSRYGVSDMEHALKKAFGEDRALLDWSNVGSLTTKVAVTATTTDTSSPCIFANYTGEGPRLVDCGYTLVTLPDNQKIPIWEAARCTSAAPSYFPPHTLRDTGSFQDGGLRHNNPVNIAQWEARVIWPKATVMDIVLSVGTGTSPSTASSTRFLSGSFIARLYRSFVASLDGQKAWEELQNCLPQERKANYFRLNVAFDGKEPALDDLVEMHRLKAPRTSRYGNELEIAESLVAKQFYFEFDHLPRYLRGRYHCSGYILCRFQGSQQAKLLKYVCGKSAGFALGDNDITILRSPLMMQNGAFLQHVKFEINSLDEEFAISLTGVGMKSRVISGFPTTATALIRNQELDNPFGKATQLKHSSARAPPKKRRKASYYQD